MKSLQSLMVASVLGMGSLVGMASASASEWAVDASHSSADFTVRHMMVTDVRGAFRKIDGVVNLDDKDPTKSTVVINLDVASIDTRDPKRDEHLKSPDFFDAAANPKITFKSTAIKKAGKDKFKVTGDLTMRGVTKSQTFDVAGPTAPIKNPWGMVVRGVSVSGKVNRKDFNVNWNKALDAGGVVVGDEVKIQVDLELVEKPAVAAPAAPGAAPDKPPVAKPAAAPAAAPAKK
ncbi:MAG: YceI family protein [Deltaproteobacteria bacterium]|nr:YceI family protein [Deltaproteobacteria bacterium]